MRQKLKMPNSKCQIIINRKRIFPQDVFSLHFVLAASQIDRLANQNVEKKYSTSPPFELKLAMHDSLDLFAANFIWFVSSTAKILQRIIDATRKMIRFS